VLQKDFDKGRAIMSVMMPLMDLLETDGKFVQKIKHGCETIGLRAGAARAPLGPMTGEEKVKLETVIATLKKNVAKVTSAKVDA
jgi:4-hydroxy-tetrahydrodipicolinate synthase